MPRVKHWLGRYWPAELAGTATLLLITLVATAADLGPIALALLATWGENLGYYGALLVREERRLQRTSTLGHRLAALTSVRNIVLEFGPAEALDTLLIRPAFMYAFPQLIGSAAIGVLVAKVAADAIFYVPVIASYELRRFLEHRRTVEGSRSEPD
jgi:hypothetical protein